MRIQSIQKARRGGKFVISFDEGSDLLVSRDVLVDFGLRKNDELEADRLSMLKDAQSFHDAYGAAGRLLNYRMRTQSELEKRLGQKGFPKPIVDKVVAKLNKIGLLDDSRFADAFVATKIASRPVGKRELERRLREKGVAKDTAEKAVSNVVDEESQVRLALAAAQTKMKSLRRFEVRKRQEKMVSFLARRGFDWDIIRKVTRKLFKGDVDASDL